MNTTNDTLDNDTATGTLHFTDVDLNDTHSVGNSFVSAIWSGGASLPSGLSTLLTNALSLTKADSTGTGAGSIGFTFSVKDNNFDFLAKDETLTVTYNVTVTDNHGVSSTEPVTIIITGTNDAPVIKLDGTYSLDQFLTQDYGAWDEEGNNSNGAVNGSPFNGEFQLARYFEIWIRRRCLPDQTNRPRC